MDFSFSFETVLNMPWITFLAIGAACVPPKPIFSPARAMAISDFHMEQNPQTMRDLFRAGFVRTCLTTDFNIW